MIILRRGATVSLRMKDGNCVSSAQIICKKSIEFKEMEVETFRSFNRNYRQYKYKEPYPIFDASSVISIEWETGGHNERIIE